MGVPKIRGTILGVPIIRAIVFGGSILGFPYLGKLPYWGGVGGRLEFTLGGPRGDIRGLCGEGLEGRFGVCKPSGLLVQAPDHKEKEKSAMQDPRISGWVF